VTPSACPRGTIDTLQSGSLRVRVEGGVDPVTKRRYRPTVVIPPGPKAEQQANEALVKMLNEVHERRHPKTNATVNQLLDRYLERLQADRKTKKRYRQLVELHVRPFIGDEKAGRVDGEILDSLYAELRRCRLHCTSRRNRIDHRTQRAHECDERCRPHECRPLSEGTIRLLHHGVLSGAYKKSVKWGWVSVSPVYLADGPRPPNPNPQPPTPEEAARILNKAWLNDPDWGMQIWLTMVTGTRRGECCAIRWAHLDLEDSVLHLGRAIAQDGSDIWEKDTKSHQDRRIVLDEQTVELLAEHRERWESRARALGIELSDTAYVFSPSPDGSTPPRPNSVTQRYSRLAKSLDIETNLHALRHYTATELITGGVDVRTVAGRLGHGGGGTTTFRVYTAWP
jgi:integrase